MQRLRLTFARAKELVYISHLDITRLWERVFRRADLPLTYSQGFSPHPKISIAAPLALGVTSEGELMDVELDRRVATPYCLKKLTPQWKVASGLCPEESGYYQQGEEGVAGGGQQGMGQTRKVGRPVVPPAGQETGHARRQVGRLLGFQGDILLFMLL